jgi:hypothetical protein
MDLLATTFAGMPINVMNCDGGSRVLDVEFEPPFDDWEVYINDGKYRLDSKGKLVFDCFVDQLRVELECQLSCYSPSEGIAEVTCDDLSKLVFNGKMARLQTDGATGKQYCVFE